MKPIVLWAAVLALIGLSTGHLWCAVALPVGVCAVLPGCLWIDRFRRGETRRQFDRSARR